eukprot:208320_1
MDRLSALQLRWPLKAEPRLSPPLEKIFSFGASPSPSPLSGISSPFCSTVPCTPSPCHSPRPLTPIAESIFPLPAGAILPVPSRGRARNNETLRQFSAPNNCRTPPHQLRCFSKLRSRKNSMNELSFYQNELSPSRNERTLVACSACHKAKACCDNVRPCSRCIRLKKSDCHDRVMAVTKTSVACIACHKAKSGCDTRRPCARCVRLGRGADCRDRAHKKPGRPRKVLSMSEPWKEKRAAEVLQRISVSPSCLNNQKPAKRQKCYSVEPDSHIIRSGESASQAICSDESASQTENEFSHDIMDLKYATGDQCMKPLRLSPTIFEKPEPSSVTQNPERSSPSQMDDIRPAPRLPPKPMTDFLARRTEATDFMSHPGEGSSFLQSVDRSAGIPDLLARLSDRPDGDLLAKMTERSEADLFDFGASRMNFVETPPPLELVSPQPHHPVRIKAINPLMTPATRSSRSSTPTLDASDWRASSPESTAGTSPDVPEPLPSVAAYGDLSISPQPPFSLPFSAPIWLPSKKAFSSTSPSDKSLSHASDKSVSEGYSFDCKQLLGGDSGLLAENRLLRDQVFMLSYENVALRSQLEFMHPMA